jgi:hypothetical protein
MSVFRTHNITRSTHLPVERCLLKTAISLAFRPLSPGVPMESAITDILCFSRGVRSIARTSKGLAALPWRLSAYFGNRTGGRPSAFAPVMSSRAAAYWLAALSE